MNNKEIVWVYGSLRYGEYNYSLLGDAKYLGRGIVRGFKMYSFGLFPFVVKTGKYEDTIMVEGYDVDSFNAEYIDYMEIGAGYRKIGVEIEVLKGGVTGGSIYGMDIIHRNMGEVTGGDWSKFKKNRYLGEMYG